MMRKIAYFIDSPDPGGAETIVIELCRRIGHYGYAPVVFHFGNRWIEERCQEYKIPQLFVPGHKLYTSALTIPLFTLIFSRFIKKQRVDILHSHLFGPVTDASFAAYLARIPHIGTLHDVYTIQEKKIRIHYLRLSAILGTKLFTVSNQMRSYFTELGNFHRNSLQTIVNGVDMGKYHLSVNRNQYPELGLAPDDVVFICVGRLEKIKGHDILLEAFKKIISKANVKLLIVGDGPNRTVIKQQVDEAGLQNYVLMLGHRNDIPTLLNLSDCFVLSSRSEGLSCSILEAMAAGLPVISTDVGGNRELVEDGVNGYLVPSEDADVLAARMQSVISNGSTREKFGEMSSIRIRKDYSLEVMVEKYSRYYSLLLRN